MDLRSGSKGELDGDAKEGSFLGKVKARGVGEMMETVGGGGASGDTSRAARRRTGTRGRFVELGAAGSARGWGRLLDRVGFLWWS